MADILLYILDILVGALTILLWAAVAWVVIGYLVPPKPWIRFLLMCAFAVGASYSLHELWRP